MNKSRLYRYFLPVSLGVICLFLAISFLLDRSITVFSENAAPERSRCYVIDAGHGGIDGGATSCTGKLESDLNLQIALRLNDIMQLLGMRTKMIRTKDVSVYTDGNTIAAQKISDLKERVRLVEEEGNPLLVSIHMNHYCDSRYSGPQVFYANTDGSRELASVLQFGFKEALAPRNNRQPKAANGIYLLKNIRCTGVLIECGFISNPQENKKLNDPYYQKKLCSVIATKLMGFSSNA